LILSVNSRDWPLKDLLIVNAADTAGPKYPTRAFLLMTVKTGTYLPTHAVLGVYIFYSFVALTGEGSQVRYRPRIMGWSLLGVAVLAVALAVVVGTALSKGSEFNRWVGWATVWALVVAAVGVALVVWDKITGGSFRQQISVDQAEDELAKVVLDRAQVTRSRLLGTDEPGDEAANVHFIKSRRFRAVGGESLGNLVSVREYYQSLSPGRLVLLGKPGMGKTVLALELVIQLLEQRRSDGYSPVPVLISAAAFDVSAPWEDWLTRHLYQRYNMSMTLAAELVRGRRILPIVDGLDEMDLPGQTERARSLVMALNASMLGRERAAVVATCRTSEYEALEPGVDRATHIEMVPMNGTEAADYLMGQFRNEQEQQRWRPLLIELNAHQDGLLASLLSTPWRLTLALTVFRRGGDPTELLPQVSLDPADAAAVSDYIDGANALLLDRYISSAVQLHDPDRRYADQQVHRWLTTLAVRLSWQADHSMSPTDIFLPEWWRSAGQRIIRIAHVALAALPTVILIAVGFITANSIYYGFSIGPLILSLLAASSPSPKRLKLRRLTSLHALGRLAASLIGGAALGLAVGFANGFMPSLLDRAQSLALGLFLGLLFGLLVGLIVVVDDPSPRAVTPRDVIRGDLLFGLVFFFVFVFASVAALMLPIGIVPSITASFTISLLIGLSFAISVGGDASVRYGIAVVLAALRGNGPLRFGAWLDWAREAGLLRESGIAYEFRHQQLQEWLAHPQARSVMTVREGPGDPPPE
jgi:hypothetical protein